MSNQAVAQSSWTTWTKYNANPVYSHSSSGAWNIASDPTVIKDGSNYVMIVSGDGGTSAGSAEGNALLQAVSSDGITWSTLSNSQNGVVVTGYVGDWDESMETPEIIKTSAGYSLFYAGYDPAVRDASNYLVWGDLGLAESSNGTTYTKVGPPVMTRTPNWYDQDGILDPTIVELNDTLFMIYVGWCTQSCSMNGGAPAFYSLKAISVDNGHSWTKQGLLDPTGTMGLQHPDVMLDADGTYSLFYGVDNACPNSKVGIFHAIGNTPFGPFTPVSINPILCMGTQSFETTGTDGAFPAVINDNGTGRMWYTGVDETNFYFKIGLSESNQVVSTPELTQEFAFTMYPNPANNFVEIELPESFQNTEITFYDQLGQVQKRTTSSSTGKTLINIDHLQSGLYILSIQNNERQLNGKLIIGE